MTRHQRRIAYTVALVAFLRLWTGDWVLTVVLGVSAVVAAATFCALLRLDRLDDQLAELDHRLDGQARHFNARQDAHHAHYDDRLAALERRTPPRVMPVVPGPRKGPTQ